MTVQIIYAIIIKSLIRSISAIKYGRFPEWPKGTDCKSVVIDFGGSNPPPSTIRNIVPVTNCLGCRRPVRSRNYGVAHGQRP